ncbi:MAG: RluA family pseudouridine synthase [Planctomycetota bacterium]|nr:RluA family pseudouridine synthase [Planctomycetota bacterium]
MIAELIVEKSLHGLRVDHFLARHFRNYTTFRLARLVRAGAVTIERAPATPEARVFRDQRVAVRFMEPPDKLYPPNPQPLEILFEDAWLVVVNKPAGLITHPVANFQSGTLANVLQAHLDEQTRRPGMLRPGIVHRLDRMTSGAIVIAKDHRSHTGLSIQFQSHQVVKQYLALVEGHLSSNSGSIDRPIGRCPGKGVLMSTGTDARNRKPALTHFRVLKNYTHATLVEARPQTGRNHQIRVHLATIGHPILGDEFYGAFGLIKPGSSTAHPDQPSRHALHADRIGFEHPISRDRLEIIAPPPADFFDDA